MSRFDLICIDMFQTLVDVETRTQFIWQRILKDRYNEQLKERCAKLVRTTIVDKFHENVNKGQNFLSFKTMFPPYFSEIRKEVGLDFDPDEAVQIFLDEHGSATVYEDAATFFQLVGDQIPVCLVSDADNEMVQPLLEQFKLDKVFISERVKSYKSGPESRIFREVLNQYGINPNKIIHIGDSVSDIIGANRHNIVTCWINRHGSEWRHTIRPDYTIKSLTEVIDILDLETKDIV